MSNNELIAEFMGLTLENQDKYGYSGNWNGRQDGKIWINNGIPDVHIPYDKDWNYLMTAVERIKRTPMHSHQFGLPYQYLFLDRMTIFTTIGTVYRGVVQFIQWYNTNEKPKP